MTQRDRKNEAMTEAHEPTTNSTARHEAWVGLSASACFATVGIVGFLVLLSWFTGRWHLGALGDTYVPMAPSTAVLLLGLSTAALLRQRRPDSVAARWLAWVSGLGVLVMSLLVWASFLFGVGLPVEQWLARTTVRVGQIPVGQMSPLAASAFLLAALAFLLTLTLGPSPVAAADSGDPGAGGFDPGSPCGHGLCDSGPGALWGHTRPHGGGDRRCVHRDELGSAADHGHGHLAAESHSPSRP